MIGSLPLLPAEFRGRRILVLGDLMLDRYIYGRASRLSPEAPVPILGVERESIMPGGAANVAANIASLGGHAVLIGCIGDDSAGRELHRILKAHQDIETNGIAIVPSRSTTEKIRYIADQQQLLRADIDETAPVDSELLLTMFRRQLPSVDAIILSDYAKGALTDELVQEVISLAEMVGKPVIVDPKSANLRRYNGAALLTPNRGEAALATNIHGVDDTATGQAAKEILASLPNSSAVLITRGGRGMTLLERGKEVQHSRITAREVFDVSGAGDTVIATLALSIACGHEFSTATQLANSAAGLVVSKPGTASVNTEELSRALQNERIHLAEIKFATLDLLLSRVERWRANGQRIGFTNGCFDLIHPGHISLLSQARDRCERLIVGLNSDSSVLRLKGAGRPVQNETARAIVLGSLTLVDQVILFDTDTPLELIERIKPDVLIKGADYTESQVVGAELVRSYGGEIFLATLRPGQSTTETISRFKVQY